MRKIETTHSGGLVLAFAALLLPACGGEQGAAPEAGAAPPTPATVPVELVDLTGVEAALAAQRGKGVLLNFWAIWCAPCVAELPELLEVRDAFADEGGVVLGVSYDLMVAGADADGMEEQIRGFLDSKGLAFPVLVFDEPDHERINERFELPGQIPVTLAFDRQGNLVDREDGPAGRERFEEMMRRALQ